MDETPDIQLLNSLETIKVFRVTRLPGEVLKLSDGPARQLLYERLGIDTEDPAHVWYLGDEKGIWCKSLIVGRVFTLKRVRRPVLRGY